MTLVICCGNPLRGDDGVGWAIARRLADATLPVTVVTSHALVPELAPMVAAAASVIFVDARAGDDPGQVRVARVHPAAEASSLAHAETPGTVLALARSLYGEPPDASLVTVDAGDLGFARGLSPAVAAAVSRAVAMITRLVDERLDESALSQTPEPGASSPEP
ncbi:MAG TPA: hydrogenase maturation protease [Vicinamibacterales bacterium]|nr:hydrogenase maturation protease [Vicinamibacterales bacterium]